MSNYSFHNDEPINIDSLHRDRFARALAKIATSCATPMVIGLYGTWGMGKTSLMKLIEEELKEKKIPTVWFDAWRHQLDENPSLAYLHTIVDSLDLGKDQEIKKTLMVIAGAFGSMLLKATTSLNIKDLQEIGEKFEEERFLVCEKRVQLQKNIAKMVTRAQELRKERIVFFIDDLDRCMPSKLLNLLETLKLNMNLPNCVYFIGADRSALENSIKFHYEKLELSGADYLEKMVQLPFTIPPIEPGAMKSFIDDLLTIDLKECSDLLVKGLGDNPRQIKRFINMLNLNHQLASEISIPEYNPNVLAFLLLLQLRKSVFFRMVADRPSILLKIKKGSEDTKLQQEEYFEKDRHLNAAFSSIELPSEEHLKQYIHLTQIARVIEEEQKPYAKIDLAEILKQHKIWTVSKGVNGERANFSGSNLSGADLSKAFLFDADLSRAVLHGANLSEANLSGADLTDAYLSGADLSRAVLHGADLSGADLIDAYLIGADLSRAILHGADLDDGNLSGADLSEAYLIGASLSRAILHGANLSGADLTEVYLSRANLIEADLSRANLSGADLIETDLSRANLSEANLSEANLSRADLIQADLSETNLGGANFSDADLSEAKNMRLRQLSEVKTLYLTKFDSKIKAKIKEKYAHLLELPRKKNKQF